MNTESMQARKVEAGKMEKPGDFCFDEEREHLFLILAGMKHADCIPIRRGEQGGHRVWGWDGNEEKPTLTPSIHLQGHWHGFLRAGVLESC